MDNSFTPISKKSFSSGRGPSDARLGDQLTNNDESTYALLGYPDDEGIKINGGRIGASLAPDIARKYLYKMTANGFRDEDIKLYDHGNLDVKNNTLEVRHQNAKAQVNQFLTENKKVISIGGGHDYGYPDGAAFLQYCKDNLKQKPVIINIDAHLDVRPTDKGLSSGTPFYRLLNEFDNFDFFQIGIQPQCNSKGHINWCLEKGGKILTHDEIMISGEPFAKVAGEFLGDVLIKPRPCFLSIDIDAFSSSFAMGCSQAWPAGLTPNEFFPFLDIIKNRMNILNLGVYELSPPLDLDDRTSKLVAQIIYRYLHT